MSLSLDWSRGPHIKRRVSVRAVMLEQALALAPCIAAAVYLHTTALLLLLLATAVTSVATERLLSFALGKPKALPDGQYTVSAIIMTLLLPLGTAWWIGALAGGIGAASAVLLGHSRLRLKVNPAIAGVLAAAGLRAALSEALSAGTGTTALYADAMPVLLAAGGLYLVVRGHVNWRTPALVLGLSAALSAALGQATWAVVSSGAWLSAAFFLAPDWRTSPARRKGKDISAALIAVTATLLSGYQLAAGGMPMAVLLGNLLTTPINRLSRPRRLE